MPDGDHHTVQLFAVAALPLVITGVGGALAMPLVSGLRHRLLPLPSSRAAAIRYSAVNYVSTLAYQAPQFVLPVIVLLSVDPDRNAAFYVAWGITSIVLYVPMAIGQALLAEGGKDGAELRSQVRVVLVGTSILMLVAATVATVGRDVVTVVYGSDYEDAARILPALVVAGVPWAITSVYLTEARVMHRHIPTVAITGVLTLAILVPALVLVPDEGIDGATKAFLVGNVAAAVVALVSHRLARRRPNDVVPEPGSVEDGLVLHP